MSVRELFRRMSPRSIANLLALNLQTTLSTIADNIYSNWIPQFLDEVHHLDFKKMGIYASLPLLGGACGGAFGGWLNDYFIRTTGNRRWSRRAVAMMGKGTAGVLLAVSLLSYDNPYQFCLWLAAVKFFSDWSLSSSWGTVSDIGGKTTASVYAFNNSVASIGAIVAPILYGFVAEYYGWKPVFLIACGTYFACAAAWLLVNCTIPVLAEEERI
jgi:ACS family glucarate transporter-like MFS transporter